MTIHALIFSAYERKKKQKWREVFLRFDFLSGKLFMPFIEEEIKEKLTPSSLTNTLIFARASGKNISQNNFNPLPFHDNNRNPSFLKFKAFNKL